MRPTADDKKTIESVSRIRLGNPVVAAWKFTKSVKPSAVFGW